MYSLWRGRVMRHVASASSVVLFQLFLLLTLCTELGAAIALRRVPTAHLARRDIDHPLFLEPNNTIHLDHFDPLDKYGMLTTYTLIHDDLHYVHVEKFEHLLRVQVGLCGSQDQETTLRLPFLDRNTFAAAREAWEHRHDLLFVLEDPTCFEGREVRSVYRPYDVAFSEQYWTVLIRAKAIKAPLDDLANPEINTTVVGIDERLIWASRVKLRWGPQPPDVVLGHRTINETTGLLQEPTLTSHKLERRTIWTFFKRRRNMFVRWWRGCKAGKQGHRSLKVCKKTITPYLRFVEKWGYKVLRFWGLAGQDEEKFRKDFKAFVEHGIWTKNSTLKAEEMWGLGGWENFHFNVPFTGFEVFCVGCGNTGTLALSWNIDFDLEPHPDVPRNLPIPQKFVREHFKTAYLRVEVMEEIHSKVQLSAVFPNEANMGCSLTIAKLSDIIKTGGVPIPSFSCSFGSVVGGVYVPLNVKADDNARGKMAANETAKWRIWAGKMDPIKYDIATKQGYKLPPKWYEAPGIFGRWGFAMAPFDVKLELFMNPIAGGMTLNLTFPGVDITIPKGQYMEIDLLRKDNRYINTIDPQIVLLPPALQTSASTIRMAATLKLTAGLDFGHDSWHHVASAGVTVSLASITASLTSEKDVDQHCKPSTDEDAIEHALGIKVDYSAGIMFHAGFFGFGVNTGSVPNPFSRNMCAGLSYCMNLYAKCIPCKFCINKVLNEYIEYITPEFAKMHFHLSDVPVLRALVDPPPEMKPPGR